MIALLLLAATLLAPPPGATGALRLPAKEQALLDKLRARIEMVDRGLDGVLGVSVIFPTASSIKAAVLSSEYGRVIGEP